MGLRTCDVWAIHKDALGRAKDLMHYGHEKHVCVLTRRFMQEHEGDHLCSCGFTYPKQETDND